MTRAHVRLVVRVAFWTPATIIAIAGPVALVVAVYVLSSGGGVAP